MLTGNLPGGGGFAGSDSGDEIVDIFHLCLRWSEYGDVSVRFSQSAILSGC
jgi:hypothetical protein